MVYYPNPILRAVCQPVDRFDSTMRDVVEEMFSIVESRGAIGLAGPQVALEQRVFVCAMQGQRLCLSNPEIKEVGQPGQMVEGCLSLPGVQISATRPERIQITGYDILGRRTRFGATGLWARVIQHELDHLNGVLICDYGKPPIETCGSCALAMPPALIEQRKLRATCPLALAMF